MNATDARYEMEHGDAQAKLEAARWAAEHTEAGAVGRIDGAPGRERVEENASVTGAAKPRTVDAVFDRCIRRGKNGCTIKCRLGLWRVDAPIAERAEREARHYWMQYHADGEYDSLLSNAGIERPMKPQK